MGGVSHLAHPHLLVRATNEHFLPTHFISNGYHWPTWNKNWPLLEETVCWSPTPVSVGMLLVDGGEFVQCTNNQAMLQPCWIPCMSCIQFLSKTMFHVGSTCVGLSWTNECKLPWIQRWAPQKTKKCNFMASNPTFLL